MQLPHRRPSSAVPQHCTLCKPATPCMATPAWEPMKMLLRSALGTGPAFEPWQAISKPSSSRAYGRYPAQTTCP